LRKVPGTPNAPKTENGNLRLRVHELKIALDYYSNENARGELDQLNRTENRNHEEPQNPEG